MQNPKQLIRSQEFEILRTILWENSHWSESSGFVQQEGKRENKAEIRSTKKGMSPTCMVLATWAGFINLFISPIVFAVEPIASESLTLAPIALAELLAAWT